MKNTIYKHLNIILLLITLFCILQLISTIFSFTLIILSSETYNIIYNLSLSWIGSYIFYLLVVCIPEKRNKFYQTKYSFWYILSLIYKWEKMKEIFIGAQEISKNDEETFNFNINKIDKTSYHYMYLNSLLEGLNIILNNNTQYDSMLIHYIDVINIKLNSFKMFLDIKIDLMIGDTYLIDSMISVDNYFRSIKKTWSKELRIAKDKYEVPDK